MINYTVTHQDMKPEFLKMNIFKTRRFGSPLGGCPQIFTAILGAWVVEGT